MDAAGRKCKFRLDMVGNETVLKPANLSAMNATCAVIQGSPRLSRSNEQIGNFSSATGELPGWTFRYFYSIIFERQILAGPSIRTRPVAAGHQALAHHGTRPKQAALDRLQREAQPGRHLRRGQLINIPQHQHGPICRGQGGNRS